jgi:hypothetical protein
VPARLLVDRPIDQVAILNSSTELQDLDLN